VNKPSITLPTQEEIINFVHTLCQHALRNKRQGDMATANQHFQTAALQLQNIEDPTARSEARALVVSVGRQLLETRPTTLN
jgi:hypothetical protein